MLGTNCRGPCIYPQTEQNNNKTRLNGCQLASWNKPWRRLFLKYLNLQTIWVDDFVGEVPVYKGTLTRGTPSVLRVCANVWWSPCPSFCWWNMVTSPSQSAILISFPYFMVFPKNPTRFSWILWQEINDFYCFFFSVQSPCSILFPWCHGRISLFRWFFLASPLA